MTDYAYAPLRTNSPDISETSYESDLFISSPNKKNTNHDHSRYFQESDRTEDVEKSIVTLHQKKKKRTLLCYTDWQSSKMVLIITYFFLNLLLIFYNKSVLLDFPFPYFITSIHAGTGWIGCLVLRCLGVQFHKDSNKKEEEEEKRIQKSKNRVYYQKWFIVFLYSTLYASNIAISNASLHLVTIPFHQIIRSTCPIFTLGLEYAFLFSPNDTIRSNTLFSLLFIVLGAILACFGDIGGSLTGMLLTILGTILAALKTVITNILQGGKGDKKEEHQVNAIIEDEEKQAMLLNEDQSFSTKSNHITFDYSALELLEIMSPLAFVQCFLASFLSGEFKSVFKRVFIMNDEKFDSILLLILFGNGITAFLLNIISFKTNKITGPLTMTVVANCKQVFTIVLAFQVYHLPVNRINLFGIWIALMGTAWYGLIGKKK